MLLVILHAVKVRSDSSVPSCHPSFIHGINLVNSSSNMVLISTFQNIFYNLAFLYISVTLVYVLQLCAEFTYLRDQHYRGKQSLERLCLLFLWQENCIWLVYSKMGFAIKADTSVMYFINIRDFIVLIT